MKKRWSFEEMMTPVWNTPVVYGESLTMLREADGSACAPLLYTPARILSVTDTAGTEEYEEGRDWVLEDGQLCLTADSRIFAFDCAEMYPAELVEGKSFPMPGGNILFAVGVNMIITPMNLYSSGFTGISMLLRLLLVDFLHFPQIPGVDYLGIIYYITFFISSY